MTRFKLLLRTLTHFRLSNLAVIAGAAIASAILTGAMMVGDSVKLSLRDLTLQRLGPIDYAMTPGRFFNEDLATRIQSHPKFKDNFTQSFPAIYLRGGATSESTNSAAAGLQIAAVGNELVPVPDGRSILNQPLADLLRASPGTTLILNLPSTDDTPKDAAFARRSRDDTLSNMRVTVDKISTESNFISLFTLTGTQRPTFNLWTSLPNLQQALDQPRRANAIFVSGKSRENQAAPLNDIIKEVARLDDYALTLDPSSDKSEVILNSRTTYILPPVDGAATAAAAESLKIPLRKISSYLINAVSIIPSPDTPGLGGGEGSTSQPAKASSPKPTSIHYAIAAGTNDLDGPIADNEVILNSWAADHLKAKIGDKIELDYYQRQPNGELKEVHAPLPFTVSRIVPMQGRFVDPTLTPSYKGLTDAASPADWDAPAGLEINKKLITLDDEAYWKKYRAAPKLFVSLNTAQKLWGSTFGDINSVRLPAAQAEAFSKELLKQLNPAEMGLAFNAVKSQQLAAATSGTDFAELFISFSFFVIAAAAILLAMLFRLSVEQRARQFGLLSALGFAPRQLRRLALAEGMLLSTIGSAIGVILGAFYTQFIIYALRTWWIGAVGTTALHLHTLPRTAITGFVSSLIVAFIAIFWSVRRLSSAHSASLLAGAWDLATVAKSKRNLASILAIATFLPALGLLILGLINKIPKATAFLSAGSLLLVSTLAAIAIVLRLKRHTTAHLSLASLGLRNAARRRARSIMTIALIAFASFTLVTVASMKATPPANTTDRRSGTGGYQLILTADLPLLGDLNTRQGRDILAIRDTSNPLWSSAKFTALRTWAGQDISCLNLTRPTAPTILGVPGDMALRGGFQFASGDWKLLNQIDSEGKTIPVIADDETATYILKLKLNESLDITDQLGRPQKLRLVATLSHSMFQSELLMSEHNFLRLFPHQSGAGTVLVECPPTDMPNLQRLLSSELADYAVSIEPTADRLARYQQVANTYLSTFQTLGSLGLLLGTIGLAVLLLRSLIERRAELALLAALGFGPLRRLTLLLAENSLLLILGLFAGTICALIAVIPAHRALNLAQLTLTLSAILVTGLVVLTVASVLASRRITSASLRAE
jgi:putative ABC transport system permease protein